MKTTRSDSHFITTLHKRSKSPRAASDTNGTPASSRYEQDARAPDAPKPGADNLQMNLVPAGTFIMGSNEQFVLSAVRWCEESGSNQGWIAFSWGEAWDPTLANTEEQGGKSLQPVGQYPGGASPFGILDMSGNAWEWVADWYDPQYYQSSPQHNPLGPPAGSDKVLRGGGFSSYFYYARTTNRGFRCVLPVDG